MQRHVPERDAFCRQQTDIRKAGFPQDRRIGFILGEDRQTVVQRSTDGPLGHIHVDVIGMDMGQDIGVHAGQDGFH